MTINWDNSNLIRSAGSRQVDRHGSPDQTRRGEYLKFYWTQCFNNLQIRTNCTPKNVFKILGIIGEMGKTSDTN